MSKRKTVKAFGSFNAQREKAYDDGYGALASKLRALWALHDECKTEKARAAVIRKLRNLSRNADYEKEYNFESET